jgi:hypothetical protein
MPVPTKPSTAGSKVTAASMLTRTAVAPPTATPSTNVKPMRRIPRKEIITVVPAKRTARPEVVIDTAAASSALRPEASIVR